MYEVVPCEYCRSIRHGNELHWPGRLLRGAGVSQFARPASRTCAPENPRCRLLTGEFRLASGLYATTTTTTTTTTVVVVYGHAQGSLAGTRSAGRRRSLPPQSDVPVGAPCRDRERPSSPAVSLDKSGRRLPNGHPGIGKRTVACVCPSVRWTGCVRRRLLGSSKEALGARRHTRDPARQFQPSSTEVRTKLANYMNNKQKRCVLLHGKSAAVRR